jgi:dTDP-glucose 4,6-dehydratase
VYSVFVTGGAGFIGSNFVHHLLKSFPGIRVVVFDKLTYAGNLENLVDLRQHPRFAFIEGDICDAAAVKTAMQDCTWVVHFAAETHVDRSIIDPTMFVRTDVEGTFTLLEAARVLGVERFIYISTSEVYGNAQSAQGERRPSQELDALKPLSPYAASKAGADCLAYSYWTTYGVPVVITRGANNYGPYQYPEKQLPLFITNALAGRTLPVYGNGEQTRDWIYVEDHCTALSTILTAPAEQVVGEVFNISAGEERSILQNAQVVLEKLGLPMDRIVHVPDRLGHATRIAVDAQKLRTRLNWQPRVHFGDGLVQTIAWYRDHPVWLEHVLARRDAFLERAMGTKQTPTERS